MLMTFSSRPDSISENEKLGMRDRVNPSSMEMMIFN